MTVKSLLVKIGADASELQSKLRTAETTLKNHQKTFRAVGMAMTAIGGGIIGTLGLMTKEYMRAGDEVQKMALRTGFSTEALSELRYAAQISGADLGALEKGVKKMQKTIIDASEGMTTYQRALKRINLTAEELIGLSPEEQFNKIALAIASVEDPTVRAATAVDVFGRAGTQLLPLFEQGPEGMEELRKKAHELGIVFDQDAADGAAALVDAQTTLKESFNGLANAIIVTVAPAITSMIQSITNTIMKIKDWVKEHPGLTTSLVKVAGAVGAVMAALGPFVMIIPKIVSGLSSMFGTGVKLAGGLVKLGGSVGSLITKLGGLQTVTLAAGAAFAGWQIGKFIGEIEIAGKSINEHITNALEKAINKLGLFNREIEYGEGHVQALSKQQQLLADASKLVGHEVTNVHEAIKLLKQHYQETGEMASTVMEGWKLDHEEATEKTNELKKKVEETKDAVKVYSETVDTNITAINGVIDKTKWWKTELIEIPTIMDNVQDTFKNSIYKDIIPAARDFSDVLGLIPDDFETISYEAKEQLKENKDSVQNVFIDVSQRIRDTWTKELGKMLSGATSFKDGVSAIFSEIKQQFFDVIAKMITEWTFNFANKVLSSIKGIGSEIAKSIGGAAKFGTSMIKTAASATTSLISSVNTLGIVATAVASIFNLFKKGADLTYTNNLLEEINWYRFSEVYKWIENVCNRLDDVNAQLKDLLIKIDSVVGTGFNVLRNEAVKIARNINDVIHTLKKLKGYAGGGYVPKPQLAVVGEVPEFIIPKKDLNAFLASTGGGITLKQNVVLNGNINSNLDIEIISKKLAERTLQAIQRGRGIR